MFFEKDTRSTGYDARFAEVVDTLIQLSEQGKFSHCGRCKIKNAGKELSCKTLCAERMISQRTVAVGMSRKAGNTQRMVTYLNNRFPKKYIYLAPNEIVAAKYSRYGAERVAVWDNPDIDVTGMSVIAIDPQAHFKGVHRQNLFEKINKLSVDPIIILIGT